MKIERKLSDFYIGQRFREKQSGRCLTITEVTNRGFKYDFDLGDQYSQKFGYTNGIPSFGVVRGGEVYVDTINQYGTFEMLYTEIDANTKNYPVTYKITYSIDEEIEWGQVQV